MLYAYCQAGGVPQLDARRALFGAPPGFLAAASRARVSRSAAMRFKSSDAGSSFGPCGTSWPVKAWRRIAWRNYMRFFSLALR